MAVNGIRVSSSNVVQCAEASIGWTGATVSLFLTSSLYFLPYISFGSTASFPRPVLLRSILGKSASALLTVTTLLSTIARVPLQ